MCRGSSLFFCSTAGLIVSGGWMDGWTGAVVIVVRGCSLDTHHLAFFSSHFFSFFLTN
jgi:hypothetical protein